MGDNPSVSSSPDPHKFETSEHAADPTYAKGGGRTSSGKKVTRLNLTATGEQSDTRLDVAVEILTAKNEGNIFRRIYRKIHFVKLQQGANSEGSDVYVNINSLSSRLHLPKEEIKQAAKDGTLADLIQKHSNYQNIIIQSYEKVMSKYHTDVNLKNAVALSMKTLMKVIRTAVPLLFNSKGAKTPHVQPLGGGRVVMAKRGEGKDQLELIVTAINTKALGEGSFGTVLHSFELADASNDFAFKQANSTTDLALAAADVASEYRMLTFLHARNAPGLPAPRGIQAKPHVFVNIAAQKGSNPTVGYLGRKYGGDLVGMIRAPPLR